MIGIVDTGGANLASVRHAFGRLGREAEVTSDAMRLRRATHVVLPGVGAAASSMARIAKLGLAETLLSLQQPVLGICLGMQLLFARSEEGDVPLLGLLPGDVRAMVPAPGRPVPHMGWNAVTGLDRAPSAPEGGGNGTNDAALREPRVASDVDQARGLLRGVPDGTFFYFVHSFVAPYGPWVSATTSYGEALPAYVRKANYHGLQFHPERSGAAGAQVLESFLAL